MRPIRCSSPCSRRSPPACENSVRVAPTNELARQVHCNKKTMTKTQSHAILRSSLSVNKLSVAKRQPGSAPKFIKSGRPIHYSSCSPVFARELVASKLVRSLTVREEICVAERYVACRPSRGAHRSSARKSRTLPISADRWESSPSKSLSTCTTK